MSIKSILTAVAVASATMLSTSLLATAALATTLPLDSCVGSECFWSPAVFVADPTTGSLWLKFESTPGAGDKGHIEGNPGDIWDFHVSNVEVPGITSLFAPPFLTDMDQPIPGTDVIISGYGISSGPDFLDFRADFINRVFVHDIHWECVEEPEDCIAAVGELRNEYILGSVRGDIITGIWDIPEPGTLALFGLGLAGLGLVRRKKAA